MLDNGIVIDGGNVTGHGSVARRLIANGMQVNALRPAIDAKNPALRTNGLLTKDEWKTIDGVVVQAARAMFNGVAALERRGLVYNPGTGLGAMMLQSYKSSKMSDAEVSMEARTRAKDDQVEFGVDYLPLPVVHKDFELGARQIDAMRRFGQGLDTTNIEEAAEAVASKVEDMLFEGEDLSFGGGKIDGYTTLSSRNQYTISDWTSSAATIIDDVLGMRAAATGDDHYGPFELYYASNLEKYIGADYNDYTGRSVRQRILDIEGIEDVKVSNKLGDGEVVLAEMQQRTIRLVEPVSLQTVQWDVEGGMGVRFKVMAVMVPQCRADQAGNCGIVHGTT